ncbi:MAG: response regulator [Calditrichia bacterium]
MKIQLYLPLWLWILLSILPTSISAQNATANIRIPGEPFITNINPVDFGFEPSCYNLAQDQNSYVYVGNHNGVMEFDGVSWKILASGFAGRSIAFDSNNTLYIGSISELGYMKQQENGERNYQSLMEHLPENKRFFAAVKYTRATSKAVFFLTTRYLFRWQNEKITSWNADGSFFYSTVIDDQLYVLDGKTGLKVLKGDSLHLVRDEAGDLLPAATAILSGNNKSLLIATLENGIYRFDGKQCSKFTTSSDELLERHRIRQMVQISKNRLAVGTLTGGLLIFNSDGRLLRIIDESTGLRYNNVINILEDGQGGLWTTHFRGMSRIQIDGPISFLSQLEDYGNVFDLLTHEDAMYVAGATGVRYRKGIYLSPFETHDYRFEPVEGLQGAGYDLLSTRKGLLVATGAGVYHLRQGKAQRIRSNWSRSLELYKSSFFPERIYVGLITGLAMLEYKNGRWIDGGKVEGVNEAVHNIVEDEQGNLWLGAAFKDVLKLENKPGERFPNQIQRYSREDGIPERFFLSSLDDKLLLLTPKGLRRFDESTDGFVVARNLGTFLIDSALAVRRLKEDANGNLWAYTSTGGPGTTAMATRDESGNWVWDNTMFDRLPPFRRRWTSFLSQPDGVCWFGGVNGVLRFDPNQRNLAHEIPSVRFRQVFANGDSLIWSDASSKDTDENLSELTMPFSQNELRFEYAFPWLDGFQDNRYRYKLVGFENSWSEWQNLALKEYTNLPEGDYQFVVQAKNVYNDLSAETTLSILILPPWYRTWWAYSVYALAGILLLFGFSKLRVRQLEQKTIELEQIVGERTIELREQKEQIEVQAMQLQEMDKYKSRFFTNISHEFRTPLTLILGPLEDMLSVMGAGKERDSLGLMQRNGRRLLQLINQLLDLSRLESGRLKLEVRRGDLGAFLKGIVLSFASLAEKRRVTLELQVSPEDAFANAYFDPDTIEKILVNLVSNAFRFTDAGGKVRVVMKPQGHQAELSVLDTGSGIAPEKQELIFERFHSEAGGQGSGVGLSLTREMVTLHRGTISVDSASGKGSCFTALFCYRREDFNESEILQAEDADGHQLPATISEKTLLEDELRANTSESNEVVSSNNDQPLLLIVEDQPDVMNYIRKQLIDDYSVIIAKNGSLGMQVAIEQIPDLIISDVMMPVKNGYELCEELKTNDKTSHIPVILLTAKADETDKITGLETGADDYLVKPFNAKELRIRVANLIEQRRKLRERYRREGILEPKAVAVTSMEETFLRRLVDIVEVNITSENFGPDVLVESLNMSKRQMQRKIRAITGQTPTDFIRSQRLQRARMLLEKRSGTVSEIAYEVGFNNLSYFARSFRKEFGIAPSELLSRKV